MFKFVKYTLFSFLLFATSGALASDGVSLSSLEDIVLQSSKNIVQRPARINTELSILDIEDKFVNFDALASAAQSNDLKGVYNELSNAYNSQYDYYNSNVDEDTGEVVDNSSRAEDIIYYGGAAALLATAGIAISEASSNSNSGVATTSDVFGRTAIEDTLDPSFFVTTEFSAYNQNALSKSGFKYAYAKGLTGDEVKVGVFDWFKKYDTMTEETEFLGHLIYLDVNTDEDDVCGLEDPCEHGTEVTKRLAANRDFSEYHGGAYKASLMLTSVYSSNGFQNLVDAGAQIINTSCDNCVSLSDLEYAVDNNVLVTAAAGNYGGPNPQYPARYADQLDYGLIVAAAVQGANAAPTYTDRCGDQKEFCLVAYSDDGTSYASPQVAAAAALVKEGWGFLTAKQISKILLSSATDLGTPGTDVVYGHGLLNVRAAVSPLGALTTISGLGLRTAYTPSNVISPSNSALGDALNGPQAQSIKLVDEYGRDFAVALQDSTVQQGQDKLSEQNYDKIGSKNSFAEIQLSENASFISYPKTSKDEGFAGSMKYVFDDKRSEITMGFADDINRIFTDNYDRSFNSNGFITSDVFENGFVRFNDNNETFVSSFDYDVDDELTTRFTSIYSDNKVINNIEDLQSNSGSFAGGFASSIIDMKYSPNDDLKLGFNLGTTYEFDTLLGSRFTGAFDISEGSTTYFSGMDMEYNLGNNISANFSYSIGLTKASLSQNSSFSEVSDIISDKFFVTVTKADVFENDKLSLSVGQPTRVISGDATGLSIDVNRQTGQQRLVGFTQSLVPSATNILVQTAYEKELQKDLNLNLAAEYASSPDHSKENKPETTFLGKIKYSY